MKIPKSYRSTVSPPKLVLEDAEIRRAKLKKPLAGFFIGRIPQPEGRPQVRMDERCDNDGEGT
jgi:hypothetical protein